MFLSRENETVEDREERTRKRLHQQICDMDARSIGSETSESSGGFDSAALHDENEDDVDDDDDDNDDNEYEYEK